MSLSHLFIITGLLLLTYPGILADGETVNSRLVDPIHPIRTTRFLWKYNPRTFETQGSMPYHPLAKFRGGNTELEMIETTSVPGKDGYKLNAKQWVHFLRTVVKNKLLSIIPSTNKAFLRFGLKH